MTEKCIIEAINLTNHNERAFVFDEESKKSNQIKQFEDQKSAVRWLVRNEKDLRTNWAHITRPIYLKEVEVDNV